MTTLALAAAAPARLPSRFVPRLVRAELLKLRRRRGLVATVAAMTVGASVVTFGVLEILRLANPTHHGPAGGVVNLGHGVFVLSLLGAVAATLVGASAGAGGLGAGVFRDVVATGRSRRELYAARIPGGLAFLLPFVAVAYALAAVATVVFAGPLPAPSATLLAESGAWLLLQTSFYFLVALGLASLVGSRSTTVGVLLAWRLALTPILMGIGFLGVLRELVPGAALERIAPVAIAGFTRQGATVPMSVSASVLVLAAWAIAAVAIGLWRTLRRDA
jgi:ABC-type transport system involved in multi-copper enzyme maturation permease subunit